MGGFGDRARDCARAVWLALCSRARNAWDHRTKVIGALGICAGAAEHFLADHPGFRFPARGVLLMSFGGVVALVGAYNTLAEFLKRP